MTDQHNSSQIKSHVKNEQTAVLAGWVPVVKIFTTKNRAVRTLWIMFTVCMVIALISSISLVVHKYLTYITVVRLDERGPQDGVSPPAITVCLTEHERDPSRIYEPLPKLSTWNISRGITRPCDSKYQLSWHSERDAISPLYHGVKHFVVQLSTQPVVCYVLHVFEQVPLPPNRLCTTFELRPWHFANATFWKSFIITIHLADSRSSFVGRPLIIVHQERSFPLDNFGRYFYEYLEPGKSKNLFWNKVITRRLSTHSKPCGTKPVTLLGQEFEYDQVACQWSTICRHYHTKCGCLCPLELVRRWSQLSSNKQTTSNLLTDCPSKCQNSFPIALVNSTACPIACHYVSYTRLNDMMDNYRNSSAVKLVLIQAEGITEMTEEELYSLAKLFSEIGGLSSFCFGFSCILFFEVFELVIRTYTLNRQRKMSPICVSMREEKVFFSEKEKDLTACSPYELESFSRSVRHKPNQFSPTSSIHPLEICRVDGSRFTKEFDTEDSPILVLKPRRFVFCSNLQKPVHIKCGTSEFTVSIEIIDNSNNSTEHFR